MILVRPTTSLGGATYLAALLALAGCGQPLPVDQGPSRLSETGLYADFGARRLADGIVPLAPRYPLWSDGAEKQRWLLLPQGSRIDTSDMDAWRFPVGTRVWKAFSLDGGLVETRLLEKRQDPDEGGWYQMAYAWRADGSDADAVPDGVRGVAGTTYEIPRQRDCGSCHYKGEKPVIGVSALQLGDEQLATLWARGLLSAAPPHPIAAPGDATTAAALGYLHGNCSHCHDSRSAVAAEVKVFMQLLVDDSDPTQTAAYTTLVDQPIHHFPDVGLSLLVSPGKPDESLVHYRMARRDAAQMPPLATHEVDEVGLAAVDAWISSLAP